MSDPSIEAALRAEPDDLIGAAREALKPIREKHEEWSRRYANRFSGDALRIKALLQDLAPLIYTTEELR